MISGQAVMATTNRPNIPGPGVSQHLPLLTLRKHAGMLRHSIGFSMTPTLFGYDVSKLNYVYADYPTKTQTTVTGMSRVGAAVTAGNSVPIQFNPTVQFAHITIGTVLTIGTGGTVEQATVTALPAPIAGGNVYAYGSAIVDHLANAHGMNEPISWTYQDNNPVAPKDQLVIPGEPVPYYIVAGVNPAPPWMMKIYLVIPDGM